MGIGEAHRWGRRRRGGGDCVLGRRRKKRGDVDVDIVC